MSAEQKERKQKEQSIFDLANEIKILDEKIKELTEKQKILKEEVRGNMKDLDVKYLKNESMEIQITYPKSFDPGKLGVEYPELYEKYTTIETITTEKVVVNKKDLERFYPEEYKDCLVELTPRLSIKRR